MKKIVLIVTLALFCLASYQASAGTFIVRNGKASGRILAADTQAEQDAAFLLQDFVKRLTGAEAECGNPRGGAGVGPHRRRIQRQCH